MRKLCKQPAAQWNNLLFLVSFLLFSIVGFSQTVSGIVTDADKKTTW